MLLGGVYLVLDAYNLPVQRSRYAFRLLTQIFLGFDTGATLVIEHNRLLKVHRNTSNGLALGCGFKTQTTPPPTNSIEYKLSFLNSIFIGWVFVCVGLLKINFEFSYSILYGEYV